ncbi:unnamed protein product, partial [Sphagnum jensenii]
MTTFSSCSIYTLLKQITFYWSCLRNANCYGMPQASPMLLLSISTPWKGRLRSSNIVHGSSQTSSRNSHVDGES